MSETLLMTALLLAFILIAMVILLKSERIFKLRFKAKDIGEIELDLEVGDRVQKNDDKECNPVVIFKE